jgi:hypothetical protein
VPALAIFLHYPDSWARFEMTSCYEGDEARGKGLARYFQQFVANLSLRGELGWMTKRASVKTTLATKRAFLVPRSQAGTFSLIREPLSFSCASITS